MQTFTGYEYILIDIANQYGKDKELFEVRIDWAKDNLAELESFADTADKKPLFLKAVQALRKAQAGEATGHLIGFDGVCSGIQVMSAMTGCKAGAEATGMVDPTKRADAYSKATEIMNVILGDGTVSTSRKNMKQGIMTAFYGSTEVPKALFGEDTPELAAFYEAAYTLAPGPWSLLQDLIGSWQPWALEHSWKLPDGFDARVKVMTKPDKPLRIEVDELDHASFSYIYYENTGKEKGLSNAANLVHSVDAYLLRSVQRRCNYDVAVMAETAMVIEIEVIRRLVGGKEEELSGDFGRFGYYIEQYERSGMPDAVILPLVTTENIRGMTDTHLESLSTMVNNMLAYKPFEVVTIHDEFRAHPNNLNYLRQVYVDVMAEIAESNMLKDLMEQLTGQPYNFKKTCHDLGKIIRESNYSLS
jgi:hypothetical protein